jgi:hypothetical protein
MAKGCHARGASRRRPRRFPQKRIVLDQRVEDTAEQQMHRDRLVHVEDVEAEECKDDIDDDDRRKARHGARRFAPTQARPIPWPKVRRSPMYERTGLLQLDARPTSWCRRAGSAWGSEVAPGWLNAAGPVPRKGIIRNQNSRRGRPPAVREKTSTAGTAAPPHLLDRCVRQGRRRQRLRVNGLIVVEAAAQHQRTGEDGKGQNGAHGNNPRKRDFRVFTLPPLRK